MDKTLEELKKELTEINKKISSEIASSMAHDGTGNIYDLTKLNSLETQKRTILKKIEIKKPQLAAEAEEATLKAETARMAARNAAAKKEAKRLEENKKLFEEMRTMGIKYKDSNDDKIRQQIESDAKEKSIKLGQVLSPPGVYSEWPITWYTYARLMHHFYHGAGQVTVVNKLLKDMLKEYNIDNTKYSKLEITSKEKYELKKIKLGGKKSKKRKSKKYNKKSRKSRKGQFPHKKSRKSRKGQFPHKKSRNKRR